MGFNEQRGIPLPPLNACLKICFGVAPSGGSALKPAEVGTPNSLRQDGFFNML
jgi:hypothetical protein